MFNPKSFAKDTYSTSIKSVSKYVCLWSIRAQRKTSRNVVVVVSFVSDVFTVCCFSIWFSNILMSEAFFVFFLILVKFVAHILAIGQIHL